MFAEGGSLVPIDLSLVKMLAPVESRKNEHDPYCDYQDQVTGHHPRSRISEANRARDIASEVARRCSQQKACAETKYSQVCGVAQPPEDQVLRVFSLEVTPATSSNPDGNEQRQRCH